jgi:hypothetical protein
MVPSLKQGNDMTKLSNEICELNVQELDRVSGGYEITTAQGEASLLRREAEHLLKTWELFQSAHKIGRRSQPVEAIIGRRESHRARIFGTSGTRIVSDFWLLVQ